MKKKKDFHLQLCVVMNVNYTCGGAHFAIYTNIVMLYTSTNRTLCVNYI